MNHSCIALALTCYDVIGVYVSEIRFCGIPSDSGGGCFHFESVNLLLIVHFCWDFQRPLEQLDMQAECFQ